MKNINDIDALDLLKKEELIEIVLDLEKTILKYKTKKKENYFINDDGLCVCVMSDMDSVYDTLAGHYKHYYGVIADDFDEEGIHKDA